jgi:fluoride ion exporter CrcB/FEX
MDALLTGALIGGLGGLLRSIIGLGKSLAAKRRIRWHYFFITVLLAVIIGLILGALTSVSKPIAFLAGYGGTDILEGIGKVIKIIPVEIK